MSAEPHLHVLSVTGVLACLCLALLTACGDGSALQEEGTPDSGRPGRSVSTGFPFTLGLGETVAVVPAGMRLTFSDVPRDSRCPLGVECAAEGESAVTLRAVTDDGAERVAVLGTAAGQETAEVGAYRIHLVGLEPTPDAGTVVSPSNYRATLRVSAAG